MAKKLFVPERMASKPTAPVSEVPKDISKGFDNPEHNDMNTKDPSEMDVSVMDRLPVPVGYRLLVIPYYMKPKTAGGIIIPDTAQEKPSEGKIVAVGSGTRADDGSVRKLDVKVNDRVLFGKFGGTEVKVDGEDLVILRESDILGIIDNKGKSK